MNSDRLPEVLHSGATPGGRRVQKRRNVTAVTWLFAKCVCVMLEEYTVQSVLPVNHHLGHISLTLRIWCFRELPH